MNTYRVTGELAVLDTKPGDTFEADLSADEEASILSQGRIEIVPRPYKVVGPRVVHDTEPGGIFEAALTFGQEQALIDAGHIRRTDAPAELTVPDLDKQFADVEGYPKSGRKADKVAFAEAYNARGDDAEKEE